jgi:hypothetical protein
MVYVPDGQNLMLDALGAVAVLASLHDGDPGPVGANNELSGGSPAYARQTIAWNAASGGSMAKSASDPEFNVPAGATVLYMGLWNVGGTTFYGYVPINGGDVDGVAAVQNAGDVFTAGGHTLSNGDRVHLKGPVGESLPSATPALDETVLYHVVGVSGDDFQVSLTNGGAAVAIDADGQAYWQKVIPEVFGSQGTLTIDTATLKLED